MISPKSKTKMVKRPVAIPTAALPQMEMVKVVAREVAEILTILFPIKIVLNILLELFRTFCKRKALLLPSSHKVLMRIRFTVVSAVSAEEKNADKAIRTINIISCTMFEVFKKFTPYVSYLLLSLSYDSNIKIVKTQGDFNGTDK